MKTSELHGAALDWAVAKCLGHTPKVGRNPYGIGVILSHYDGPYSTEWQYGGPVIERESIGLWHRQREHWEATTEWTANKQGIPFEQTGETPLIAAMRCFIASKLGDEVEIPEDIML